MSSTAIRNPSSTSISFLIVVGRSEMESNIWTGDREFGPRRIIAQPGLDELCRSGFSTKVVIIMTLSMTTRRFS